MGGLTAGAPGKKSSTSLFSTDSSSSSSSSSSSAPIPGVTSSSPINWYPGHISSGEKSLSTSLSSCDVILEVRDSRCVLATAHPDVSTWSAGVGRVIVITKKDLTPPEVLNGWLKNKRDIDVFKSKYEGDVNQRDQKFKARGVEEGERDNTLVMAMDLKKDNTRKLRDTIFKLGKYVNERRERKGIKGRPIRVGVVGYPNTGKSTLINKLVGRKRCKVENQPGVTKGLNWVKVKGTEKKGSQLASGVAGGDFQKTSGSGTSEFELLDTPGIIPKKLSNHLHAHMLAASGCVGRKGYDNQRVAQWLLGWFVYLDGCSDFAGRTGLDKAGPEAKRWCRKAYGAELESGEDGEMQLHRIAESVCKGDLENAANKVLQDFRSGRMGRVALQAQWIDEVGEEKAAEWDEDWDDENWEDEEMEYVSFVDLKQAREEAEEEGIDLPEMVKKEEHNVSSSPGGAFEGW